MNEQQLDNFIVALYTTAPQNTDYFEQCFAALEDGRFTQDEYLDTIMESFSQCYYC